MKRLMMLFFGWMALLLGCSPAESVTDVQPAAKPDAAPAEKVLVVYFSRTGNTRAVADEIAKTTGAKVFELAVKTPYPEAYQDCIDFVKKERAENRLPELAAMPPDWADYTMVFVGSPNWWGTLSSPVLRFMKDADFSGKSCALFVTHGGGGMQNCETDFRANLGAGKYLLGKAFSGGNVVNSTGSIQAWTRECLRAVPSRP